MLYLCVGSGGGLIMNTNSAVATHGKRSPSARLRAVTALLWSLTLLFTLRVAGQAVQRWWPQPSLPPFDAFQGSGLPYLFLLSAQLIILVLMVRAALRVGAGTLSPSQGQLRFLLGFGAIYLAGSVLRIVIGVVAPAVSHWFTAWIPAFFHLVLAAFVITLALHARSGVPDSLRESGTRA